MPDNLDLARRSYVVKALVVRGRTRLAKAGGRGGAADSLANTGSQLSQVDGVGRASLVVTFVRQKVGPGIWACGRAVI